MKVIKHYQIKQRALLELIEQQNLKRWWVAEVAGIHKTTLRRWLQGKTRYIQEKKLSRVAEVLAVPVVELAQPILRPRQEKQVKTNI